MRRKEIIQAGQKIIDAITRSEILKGFEETAHRVSPEREIFNADLMYKLHQYSLLASDYGPIEKQIIDILGLTDLTNPQKWSDVVYTREGSYGAIFVWNRYLYFAVNYLPLFLELIKPDYLTITQEKPEELPDEYKGKALLTTILVEDSKHPVTLERVMDLLSGISSLYEASSTIIKHPAVPLIMIGCDSGSEKAFDFLGAEKIMQMVKEILLSLWDSIMFFHERQVAQKFELVAESLPIIEQLDALEDEDKIGHEEAALLCKKIVDSVQKFITCGAFIPEMQEKSTFDPHELMMPEPKLLEEGQNENE